MAKFIPRQRKQKKRQRESKAVPIDTNAAELQPSSKSEKEAKRQKLRDDLRSQHGSISSKKQKRLDKYIVRLDSFKCYILLSIKLTLFYLYAE